MLIIVILTMLLAKEWKHGHNFQSLQPAIIHMIKLNVRMMVLKVKYLEIGNGLF